MYGHISSLSWVVLIREELTHEIFQRESTLLEHARLSVLAGNHIAWI